MLDTCVRNCHPLLHTTLATSFIWSDMVKLVQDTSMSRIDDEVCVFDSLRCKKVLVPQGLSACVHTWFMALPNTASKHVTQCVRA